MYHNAFSTQQTATMRAALEFVVERLECPDNDALRMEVASVVISIAMEENHDAGTLADLAVEKLRRLNPSYRN